MRISDCSSDVCSSDLQLLAFQDRDIAEDIEASDLGGGNDDRLIGVTIILAVPGGGILCIGGRREHQGKSQGRGGGTAQELDAPVIGGGRQMARKYLRFTYLPRGRHDVGMGKSVSVSVDICGR